MVADKKRTLTDEVAERIEAMRLSLDLTQGAVAEGAGMERSNLAHKIRRTKGKEALSIDQAERIAAYFRRYTGKKLLGWPFIDLQMSEMLEHVVALMDSTGR